MAILKLKNMDTHICVTVHLDYNFICEPKEYFKNLKIALSLSLKTYIKPHSISSHLPNFTITLICNVEWNLIKLILNNNLYSIPLLRIKSNRLFLKFKSIKENVFRQL